MVGAMHPNRNKAVERQVRAAVFVGFVAAAAILLFWLVFRADPAVHEGSVQAVLLLGTLALMAEAWQFMLPRSAAASIAFIPFTAMALVVPNWVVLAAIAGAKLIEAIYSRRAFVKSTFNIALFVAMFGSTILVYRAVGGTGFLPQHGQPPISFADVTQINGMPAIAAFFVVFAVNMMLLSTVIALHSDRTVMAVWRENHLPGLALELLAAPIVFLFAWVYVAYGPIGACLVWVPILGYRHTIKTTLDLETTNRELLELMIKSIEARDPYTSGHSRRVQHYAMLIARALGLSEREVEHVSTSALLHDVGKIHEKYGKILTKEEKLSPDEWALMREHPIDGANLVATMTRLQQFVGPVRHHHENWDGTGYPDGLAGDLIPLASRIIMFADTIDAMTTARPYRGPLSEEVVRAEIVRRRGEQFDPAIADSILSSPIWRQLFVPAHPSIRGHEMALAGSTTVEVVGASRTLAKRIAHRVSNDR
jgi:putative nucleotidyltransferase with HDIG domain